MRVTEDHLRRFAEDGFVLIEDALPETLCEAAAARFPALFRGAWESGIEPDEWNWREGRDAEDLTRQICNGWRADAAIAAVTLREEAGRAAALAMGWTGARLAQDNVIWKPPGARSLGFHQDDSYCAWFTPATMASVWVALDDVTAEGGTIEYARGSHLWGLAPPPQGFHAPEDHEAAMRAGAADAGVAEPEITRIRARAGDAVIHHGRTWHGSGPNRARTSRRALVSHCVPASTRYSGAAPHPIYSRYRERGSDAWSESHFPVLWTREGGRSAWLDGA